MKRLLPGLGLLAAIGFVVAFVAAPSWVRFMSDEGIAPPDAGVPDEGVMCTMEAKLCPDGSYVGRSGPNCEFAPCPANEPSEEDRVSVAFPQPDAVVMSPLLVRGEARGTWYFEASFPIRLLDAEGNVLATAVAQAEGDWMTTEFVPFQATLTFAAPKTAAGTLLFERDNPSGLPEQAATVSIPVRFVDQQAPKGRTVQLYFYDPEKDRDESGNILCSRQGLVTVERTIPITQTPIQDTIRLLLRGELTASERARGITTEYPLPGLALSLARLENGTLTLTLSDERMQTSGGSCRVGILWSQIEATAQQFKEVKEVKFWPEELFQP